MIETANPSPMRAVVGIQARMSSTRLPGKVLAGLAGKPLIQRLWERVERARHPVSAAVLTSSDPSDDPLASFLERAGIPFRRGSLDDVMSRYLHFASETRATHVLRVTGDCPLVDPDYLDLQIEAAAAFDADLVVLPPPGAPGTLSGQALVSVRALRDAARSDDPRDREHVGAFHLIAHRARYRTVMTYVDRRLFRDDLRLCVDEQRDLDCLRAIFEELAPEHDSDVPLLDAVRFVDANPRWLAEPGARESAANRAARRLALEAPPHTVVGCYRPGESPRPRAIGA